MCGSVKHTIKNETIRVYFPNPQAKLPILMRGRNISLLPWDVGKKPPQKGGLYIG